MTGLVKQNVVAIIVTHQPKLKEVFRLVDRLNHQVESIAVIDNGSTVDIGIDKTGHLIGAFELIQLHENRGVAAAQNMGIQLARSKQARAVLLMDQDSIPAPDMVTNLLSAMNQKKSEGERIAAVGPCFTDIKEDKFFPFAKLIGWRLCQVLCPENEVVEVGHLISSGCLILLDVVDEIGGMEESLFIDYVDIEWCLRASRAGYKTFGVGSARMIHDLGDSSINLWGRSFPVHTAQRYYYIVRNGIWLILQNWVPINWKIADTIRLIKIYIIFSLFAGSKFDNWIMMTKGLWHGITNQMGKFQPPKK